MSLAAALSDVGYQVGAVLGRGDDVVGAARGVDVLVIATCDDSVADVAARVEPQATTAVIHLSGALGLSALAPHPRRASLHPLVPLPSPEIGRRRLLSGATFAVAGDAWAAHLAEALGGRPVPVSDDQRARYHAAACIASNHVVAVLGQVERVAASVGLPLQTMLGLTRAALDDVEALGPARALTGPAARGDWSTIERHRSVLPADERTAYDAGVALARRLVTPAEPTPMGVAASPGAPRQAGARCA
jgi:predicted short-subunit dehydrogenase-like oxidoreductase (DUF2520 family)